MGTSQSRPLNGWPGNQVKLARIIVAILTREDRASRPQSHFGVVLMKEVVGAGVKRMTGTVHQEARTALKTFLSDVLHDVVIITEHAKRHTVTVTDILLALKRRGRYKRSTEHAFALKVCIMHKTA